MHQFSGNQKIIKKHKQKTKNTQTKKQTTTKIQNEKPKTYARVLCICFFAFFLVSFLIFLFSGDSGIPDLHFSLEKNKKDDEETKKKRKRKKGKKTNCDRVLCIFVSFRFPINAVWQRPAKADKNGQMHCWKQSDFSMCAMLFPYLPICSYVFPYSHILRLVFHLFFWIVVFFPHNIVYFQFSNECMPLDSLCRRLNVMRVMCFWCYGTPRSTVGVYHHADGSRSECLAWDFELHCAFVESAFETRFFRFSLMLLGRSGMLDSGETIKRKDKP